jgi:hypothetical protein
MNFQKLFVPAASLVLLFAAWRSYGWPGLAIVAGGLVMWLLLHFTRMMTVLKRAADRPVGHVGSAVMLNAKLRPGVTLMHVIAMTRSLGELRSPKGEQPEHYRWTDGSQSRVDCEFNQGKLVRWTLQRPSDEPEPTTPPAP